MSEAFRIALVAEGPTDYEIIQAVLRAVLENPFVLTLLQPEATQPQIGTGWCGVLKWCQQANQRHSGLLEHDPTLANFYDLIIIHLDSDVASKKYADCGQPVESWDQRNTWESLPCNQPCPPVSDTVEALVKVIQSWLGHALGDRTLLCLPAQSSGTWLVAAVLNAKHEFLTNAECDPNVEARLAQLPKDQRIKKKLRDYRIHAESITTQWDQVKQICSQAHQFEYSVLAAISC